MGTTTRRATPARAASAIGTVHDFERRPDRLHEGLGTCAPVGNCSLLDQGSCASDAKHPVCRIVDPTGAVACTEAAIGTWAIPATERTAAVAASMRRQGKYRRLVPKTLRSPLPFRQLQRQTRLPRGRGHLRPLQPRPRWDRRVHGDWNGPGLEVDAGAVVADASAGD